MTGFLVLHGWRNRRPPDHWHHLLVHELRSAGHVVSYPQLPDPDEPWLDDWLATALGALAALPPQGERVVVAHSLGCLQWWQAASRGLVTAPVDRVLLVAPPSPEVTRVTPEIAAFDLPAAVGAKEVAAASRGRSRLVCSEGDDYAPDGADLAYAERFDLDVDRLTGQAHINPDSGYGEWASALAWCLDPATRLVARDAVTASGSS